MSVMTGVYCLNLRKRIRFATRILHKSNHKLQSLYRILPYKEEGTAEVSNSQDQRYWLYDMFIFNYAALAFK